MVMLLERRRIRDDLPTWAELAERFAVSPKDG
jgi:hypothetical protein